MTVHDVGTRPATGKNASGPAGDSAADSLARLVVNGLVDYYG
ncbi:hypothetical protein [Actinomycetospora callitridis]|nr:hypothetical protein [Actinomycetospora callitridis]MDD7919065.1 hypothetical protein [Actinomycetospora callitridis]